MTITNTQMLETLKEAAATISCLLDYIGESNAIRTHGAREEYNHGRFLVKKINVVIVAAELAAEQRGEAA